MSDAATTVPRSLEAFISPMLHRPAWGVRQGHGSFLTFEFGEPNLEVTERRSAEKGSRRLAVVHGEWHLWIYCCHWKALEHGEKLAWSADSDTVIGRATAMLNGQKLLSVTVTPSEGRSTFTFDLGGSLETWPYGGDATEEQWTIMTEAEAFTYRADGTYSHEPSTTPSSEKRWLPLQ